MGHYIILTIKCAILPQYIDFIAGKYLENSADIPYKYKWLTDRLEDCRIGYFNKYELKENIFTAEIQKKANMFNDEEKMFLKFVKKIMLPISEYIETCNILDDLYSWSPGLDYKDVDLRRDVEQEANLELVGRQYPTTLAWRDISQYMEKWDKMNGDEFMELYNSTVWKVDNCTDYYYKNILEHVLSILEIIKKRK